MSQPVKVSDSLILDARLMSEASHRSIAGQIEFWANLGRAVEVLLRGDKLMALAQAGKSEPLSECIKSVNTPLGRRRLMQHLKSLPYPHSEPASGAPGLLARIEADGQRTVGRFVNRQFQVVRPLKSKARD